MRAFLFIVLIIPLFLAPFQSTHAQTADRAALYAELQSLLAQLTELRAELAARQETRMLSFNSRQLTPSQYHNGPYEAIYLVDGTALRPYGGTVEADSDHALWSLWRDVVGQRAIRRYTTEFRIYNDPDAEFDAFIEQLGSSDDWVFGVNRATVDVSDPLTRRSATTLFIHEYAHILYYYHADVAAEFEGTFWGRRSQDADDYVSDYAMIDAEEDFAESFAYFVENDRPRGDSLADAKVRFFYDFGLFRDLRSEMHERL